MSSNHTPEYHQLPLWEEALTQRCTKCGQEFPATKEYFGNKKKSLSGLNYWCKECNRKATADYRKRNPEYAKNYRQITKEQSRMYQREYRKRFPEKSRNYVQNYRKRHPERIQEYKERNKENAKAYSKQYNLENIAKYRIWYRNHYKNNPEQYKERYDRRRARLAQADGFYTEAEIKRLYKSQHGLCFHCDADLDLTGFHRDHWIPLSRGGSNWISNIRLLCPTCNLSKGAKLPCEWNSRYCD